MAKEGFGAALEYQLVGERAHSLGIAGQQLKDALGRLRAFDANPDRPSAKDPWRDRELRDLLVKHAAERLWMLVVQREACGFTLHDPLYEIYDVPLEVRARV